MGSIGSISSMMLGDFTPEIKATCKALKELFEKNGAEYAGGRKPLELHCEDLELFQEARRLIQLNGILEQRYSADLEMLKERFGTVAKVIMHHHLSVVKSNEWLNISKFKNLSVLELKMVPLKLVIGLDKLRPNLKTVIVWRSAFTLDFLLARCLADGTPAERPGSEWFSLTSLSVSHNNITSLSRHLKLAPNLHTLSAVYNQIVETEGLLELPNLKQASLSFNKLRSVPRFHPKANLTKLILSFNRIERLMGLELLVHLEYLDLSGNCIMHHDSLAPISQLPKLKELDTRYNPVATLAIYHRLIVSSWLSHEVKQPFLLDQETLTGLEFAQIGSSRPMRSLLPRASSSLASMRVVVPIASSSVSLSAAPVAGAGAAAETSAVGGAATTTSGTQGPVVIQEDSREGSLASCSASVISTREKRRKSKKRIREVVIQDQPSDIEEAATDNRQEPQIDDSGVSAAARELEMLRAKYGEDNWLREQAGETLQKVLGIEPTVAVAGKSFMTIGNPESAETNESASAGQVDPEKVKPDLVRIKIQKVKKEIQAEVHAPPEPQPAQENAIEDDPTSFYSMYQGREKEQSPAPVECRLSVEREAIGDDELTAQSLTLSLDKEFIHELDGSGASKVKWFLHSLQNCAMLECSGGVVTARLFFDTALKEKQERVYKMSEASFARLIAVTGSHLEQSNKKDNELTSLQCIKCQSIFTQELADKKLEHKRRKSRLEVICINCGSDMVVEVREEMLKPGLSHEPIEEGEEAVTMGIPACEAFDLDSIEAVVPEPIEKENKQESGISANSSPISKETGVLQVNADIHDHPIQGESELPDVLPKQAYMASRQSITRGSSVHRSESSSDISILSDGSIEVLQKSTINVEKTEDTEDEVIPIKDDVMEDDPHNTTMTESSSTINTTIEGRLTDSIDSGHSQKAASIVSTADRSLSKEESKSDTEMNTSTHNSPRKSIKSSEDESTYHSCYSIDAVKEAPDVAQESPREERTSSAEPTLTYQDQSDSFHEMDKADDEVAGDSQLESDPEDAEAASIYSSAFKSEKERRASEGSTMKTDDLIDAQIEPNEHAGDPAETAIPLSKYMSASSIISWNYKDFGIADHRVQLYCELSLFNEEEENLIVIAKGDIYNKASSSYFEGVLVLSNKKLYLLKITAAETEEPGDWLEEVYSIPVLKIERLVQLLSGQGLALELGMSESKPMSTPYFSRAFTSSGVSAGSTNTVYLILRDLERTEILRDQIVDGLQERVRSNPIPVVTDLNNDVSQKLNDQLMENGIQTPYQLFNLATNLQGEKISVICCQNVIVLAEDFFKWHLNQSTEALAILDTIQVKDIENLDIYQTYPGLLKFSNGKAGFHVVFHSEKGVQNVVRHIRTTWETEGRASLEEVTNFHMSGSSIVLKMSTLMSESLSSQNFDLSQWIKVTSVRLHQS